MSAKAILILLTTAGVFALLIIGWLGWSTTSAPETASEQQPVAPVSAEEAIAVQASPTNVPTATDLPKPTEIPTVVEPQPTATTIPPSATTIPASPTTIPTATATAPPPTATPIRSDLPDLGIAPEIANEIWINSDHPVRLADLRGQVVMVEFWTFDCYNCKNVLPSLKEWYQTYNADGFEIVSIHYPEFAYEREYDNVLAAVNQNQIAYPVALDNDGATWRTYKQRYWPTLYLIDKEGHIRYKRIGEGAYEQTEAAIQALLAEEYPDF